MDYTMLVNKTNRLDASFVPSDLVVTDSSYKDNIKLNRVCFEAFKKLRDAASEEGYQIDIMSGYRDYDYQDELYKRLVYEKGVCYAFRSVAQAGASEHQTGLAIDYCVYFDNRCYIEHDIDDLLVTKWVSDHAHEYGFILRYPFDKEEITLYNYEPWHLRYVGDLASYLYDKHLTLEEYYLEK